MLINREADCRALADVGSVVAGAFIHEMKLEAMKTCVKDLKDWDFHELAAKGAGMIAGWLGDGADEDKEETAAADFARAFLSAGVVNQVTAFPFESVYTSPTHLVMQDAYEAVRILYHRNGFVKGRGCDWHEDHIALELQFLAELSRRAAKAYAAGDKDDVVKTLQLQKSFIEKHIDNWVPRFVKDIRDCPVTPFYKGWSYILEGYVLTLKDAVEGMLEECQN